MQDEIQKKVDDYEKTKSTMNATKQQETEASIQELLQKFQQAQQDKEQGQLALGEVAQQPAHGLFYVLGLDIAPSWGLMRSRH